MYDAGEDAALIAEHWDVRHLHSPRPPIRSRFHFLAPPSFSSGPVPLDSRSLVENPRAQTVKFFEIFFSGNLGVSARALRFRADAEKLV